MRTIEKFDKSDNEWIKAPFKSLKNGDVFRIFDNNKRYVNEEDGNNVWIAISDFYQREDGMITIDTLY